MKSVEVKCKKDVEVNGIKVYEKGVIYPTEATKKSLLSKEYKVSSPKGVGVFDEKDFKKNFKIM